MTIEELGQLLNDIVMNPEESSNADRMRVINDHVYDLARKESGVLASDLADENQENSPRVRHFWTLTSVILAKVYMSAALQLHHIKDH
jgi:hypothetical protein